MTATSQVQTVPGTGQTTAGTSQNPNNVVGPNTSTGTQTCLGNLPYAGAQPGSLPNQAYGPYGYANGSSAPGDPFTNNPNMAAGAYLTPGYPGTGQFGAYGPYTYGNGSLTAGMAPQGAIGSGYYGSYAPNSYGNSGYVPGYGASFGSNAAGSYTAGYAPANGYYPSTQNGQNQSSYYRPNGMNRSNQANSAPDRPPRAARNTVGGNVAVTVETSLHENRPQSFRRGADEERDPLAPERERDRVLLTAGDGSQ